MASDICYINNCLCCNTCNFWVINFSRFLNLNTVLEIGGVPVIEDLGISFLMKVTKQLLLSL